MDNNQSNTFFYQDKSRFSEESTTPLAISYYPLLDRDTS